MRTPSRVLLYPTLGLWPPPETKHWSELKCNIGHDEKNKILQLRTLDAPWCRGVFGERHDSELYFFCSLREEHACWLVVRVRQ